jgi:hypothetical protein
MTSVFGEATTTVVADNFKAGDEPSFSSKEHAGKATSPGRMAQFGASKGKEKVDEFVATTDYTLEERPFFIRIGKNGVTAALEKLDEQLVQVSLHLSE